MNRVSPTRPALAAMADAEFVQWQTACKVGLQHAIARTDAYLSGRRKRGIRTGTDSAMEADLVLFRDLLRALNELDALRAPGAQAATGHSGHTGMMLMYDTPDGKLKP